MKYIGACRRSDLAKKTHRHIRVCETSHRLISLCDTLQKLCVYVFNKEIPYVKPYLTYVPMCLKITMCLK